MTDFHRAFITFTGFLVQYFTDQIRLLLSSSSQSSLLDSRFDRSLLRRYLIFIVIVLGTFCEPNSCATFQQALRQFQIRSNFIDFGTFYGVKFEIYFTTGPTLLSRFDQTQPGRCLNFIFIVLVTFWGSNSASTFQQVLLYFPDSFEHSRIAI